MKKQSASKSFAVLGTASVIVKVLAIIYLPFQTYILGNYGNGVAAKGYSIYTFLFSLSNAGLPNAISKLVSEQTAYGNHKASQKILRCAYMVLLCLGASVALFMGFGARAIASSPWIDQSEAYLMLIMFAPTLIFTSVTCALRGYFQGRQNMIPVAVSQVVEQIFNTVFTVLFEWILVRYGSRIDEKHAVTYGAAGSALGTLIAAVAAAAFLCFVYFSVIGKQRKREVENTSDDLPQPTTRQIYMQILHYSLPAILNTIAACAASLIDNNCTARLRAGGFSEEEATSLFGVYSYQYGRIILLATIFTTALVTTMIPAISEAIALRDQKLIKHRFSQSYKSIYLVTIPSIAGITALAQPLITLVFVHNNSGSDLVMFGAWTAIFTTIQSVQTGALIAAGKPVAPSVNLIIGMAVKILLNYELVAIPWLNIKGAIIGTAIGYVIAIVLNQISINSYYRFKLHFIRMMIKPTFASVVMGVVCYFFFKLLNFLLSLFIRSEVIASDIAVIATVVVGVAVYFAVIIMIHGVRKRDIMQLPFGAKIYRFISKIGFLSGRLV